MAFLLQDGALYIPTKRAFDIWDTLIANPNACDMDRMVSGVMTNQLMLTGVNCVASVGVQVVRLRNGRSGTRHSDANLPEQSTKGHYYPYHPLYTSYTGA